MKQAEKGKGCGMKMWRVIPAIMAGALLSVSPVFADDDTVKIDDLKAQLAASSTGKPAADVEQFTVSESELDQENSKLQAQEAEILKKLNQQPGGEAVPTGAQNSRKGADFDSPSSKPGVITVRGNAAVNPNSEESNGFVTMDREPAPPVNTNSKELVSLRSSNSDLKGKLSQSQEKLTTAQKELKDARDRLMMAEAEVERLSQLLEKRGNSGLDRVRASAPIAAPAAAAIPAARAPQVVPARAQEDLPIATVIVDKANLRTGPSTENSALMSVSKGTRLVIETRNGSWYRVFAPNGTRAWITGDVLSFSPSGPEAAGSTLRVRAVDASMEKETNRIFGRSVN